MIRYHALTFNLTAEQTYIVWDETLETCIIDPGCSNRAEEEALEHFITSHSLKPIRLICTHLHFDHCFGAEFVQRRWGLTPEASAIEIEMMPSLSEQLRLFGIIPNKAQAEVTFSSFRTEGGFICFGKSRLQVLSVPGHAPGHVVFYNKESRLLFAGDTLFNLGIGRTDLWGGDYDTLISGIRSTLFTLPDDVIVLSGHGPATTIGDEKRCNPYFA